MDTHRTRTWSGRKAILTRWKGADHPDTIRAGRELAAAKLAAAVAVATREGLDNTNMVAVVRTGELPAEAAA